MISVCETQGPHLRTSLTLSDQRVMQAPEITSRQSQASRGWARMSLPIPAPNVVAAQPEYQSPHFTTARNLFNNTDHTRRHGPRTPTLRSSSTTSKSYSSPAQAAGRTKAHKQSSRSNEVGTATQMVISTTADTFTQSAPAVRGIRLRSPRELPDRLATVFPFQYFNAVQSKSFPSVFETGDNFVLSSPTGSGKTAIFELAICRVVNQQLTGDFKIVYMAPTKALCTERTKDWKSKFSPLGLNVEEITGDSEIMSLRCVQTADIIVTTPEKWDSLTRQWKDHKKLMLLIRLVLIDEVHILNKDRGATLEAVVSRMKSSSVHVRFIALSATVPNSRDLAVWLGRSSDDPGVPAIREEFGEDFRPVLLRRHVFGFEGNDTNDFAFDGHLTTKQVRCRA